MRSICQRHNRNPSQTPCFPNHSSNTAVAAMFRNHMSLQIRLFRRTVIALIAPMFDMLVHRLSMVPEGFAVFVLALAVFAGEDAVGFGLMAAGG
jgi:hypothetical protein